jgi:hypothetical protein
MRLDGETLRVLSGRANPDPLRRSGPDRLERDYLAGSGRSARDQEMSCDGAMPSFNLSPIRFGRHDCPIDRGARDEFPLRYHP